MPTDRAPRPGEVLWGDDGVPAVVVMRGWTKALALSVLLNAAYGGRWNTDDPVVVEEAEARLRFQTWRSCTKAWKEGEGVPTEDPYWSSHGDGQRRIDVAVFEGPGNIYDLGDDMVAEQQIRRDSE